MRIAPVVEATLTPTVIICSVSPDPVHAIDRGGSPQYATARRVNTSVGLVLVKIFICTEKLPVVPVLHERNAQRRRHLNKETSIARPCFDQQHIVAWILRKACCKCTPGGARPNDDVVVSRQRWSPRDFHWPRLFWSPEFVATSLAFSDRARMVRVCLASLLWSSASDMGSSTMNSVNI